MKKTATIIETNEATVINPFETLGASASTSASSRKLAFTDVLNGIASERANEAILAASQSQELYPLANAMMDSGDPADLVNLFNATGTMDHVAEDAVALQGADEDTLKKMLESRRSDRSKSKKKGVRSHITVCKAYVGAFYAELVIREAMGKPYTGRTGVGASVVNTEDLDAVNRRIKSLQSKKCRLGKLAKAGDAEAQAQLDETIAEIERLQAFRPATSTTVVKSIKVDELREALSKLQGEDLPDEVRELLAKIG